MTQSTAATAAVLPRPRRRRRWGRWVLLVVLAIVTALAGTYRHFTSSARVSRMAAELLQQKVGGEVRIAGAKFNVRGPLVLRGVELRVPELPGQAGQLLQVEEILIEHDWHALLHGRFEAQRIVIRRPTVYVSEDGASHKLNFQFLRPPPPADGDGTPPRLPEMYLSDGRVVFGDYTGPQFAARGTMEFSGSLIPAAGQPDAYAFTLSPLDPAQKQAPILTGQLDLRPLKVSAQLEHFTFDSLQWNLLPGAVRKWWQDLDPVGELPIVRLTYAPGAEPSLTAELTVRDVALTLPYADMASRMAVQSGRFRVVDDAVEVRQLRGEIEGIRYEISGQVQGLKPEAAFTLAAHVEGNIPEQPRYLPALVKLPEAERIYRQFTPSGAFSAEVKVDRKQAGGAIVNRGTVRLLDVRGRYRRFSYPLTHVRGTVAYNDDRVDVEFDAAGPTGAQVHVKGNVDPPTRDGAVDFTVALKGLPFDRHLLAIMQEDERAIVQLFLNDQEHGALVRAGLIRGRGLDGASMGVPGADPRPRSSAQPQPPVAAATGAATQPAGDVPQFDLGGRADVVVRVQRPLGPEGDYTTRFTLDLTGLNALIRDWPYPLHLTAGQVDVQYPHVTVTGVEARGLSGATCRLSGRFLPEEGNSDLVPDLKFTGASVPVDALLRASMPDQQARWLEESKVTGQFDAQGTVGRNAQGKVGFTLKAQLKDATAQPLGSRFDLRDLTAAFALESGRMNIERLHARHDETDLEASAEVRWLDTGAQIDLNLKARGLRVDDKLAAALPADQPLAQKGAELFARYKPVGLLDADATCRFVGGVPEQYRLDLRPSALSFDFRGQRLALGKMTGVMTLLPGKLVLDRCTASLGEGRLGASGAVTLEDRPSVELDLDAQGPALGQAVRLFCPADTVAALDGLQLKGSYEIRDAHLSLQPPKAAPAPDGTAATAPATQPASDLSFVGHMKVSDAAAHVGADLTAINGELGVQFTRRGSEAHPRLDLSLDASSLRLEGRLIDAVKLRLASAPDSDRLLIRQFHGSCYGGTVTATGEIERGDPTRYYLSTVLLDVPMQPLLHPEQDERWRRGTPDPASAPGPAPGATTDLATGTLSASLDLTGAGSDPATRHGRGELRIRDARLYEVPVGMALLRLINLSWPASRSFDQLSAAYVIDGDRVHLERVLFDAPGVQIAGSGTLRYSTRQLDLLLYSRNPAAPQLGPVSDVLTMVKDELVGIVVTGTLDQPQAKAQSLTAIKRSWEDVFGPRTPDQRLDPGRPITSGQ